MNHLPTPDNRAAVLGRKDEPYTGKKRLMIKRAARVKHPVISTFISLVMFGLYFVASLDAPLRDEYFTAGMMLFCVMAIAFLLGASVCKYLAVVERRHYWFGYMWFLLGLAYAPLGMAVAGLYTHLVR